MQKYDSTGIFILLLDYVVVLHVALLNFKWMEFCTAASQKG